ncbi:flavin reductase family protein [Defluviitalea phaphyphila]|uniref:flavin reductase family protein n=1 Tax=Defluviitalea phaphyphila TaxID=1473580 RepID=UPI00073099EC|nr:flavin reductase family protein [Defluviitalea phaphyphila]
MFKDINYDEYAKEVNQQLPKGAFLTVKNKEKSNTMTIGWGSIGLIWGKPIFIAMVRYSRHTYDLIKESKEFTISVPLKGQLKKELGFCGSKSGRDMDKFKECGLTPIKGKVLETPIIDGCDLYYECKVVYNQAIDPSLLDKNIDEKWYSNHDYHVIYYGEILASYIKDE